MKKNLGKILAMAIAAIMVMSTVAFAAPAVADPADAVDNVVTVSLSGLTAGEEATILVVKDEVDPSTISSSNTSDIIYIDQITVDENGNAVFDFDASAAVPANATADVYVDIYCGYTSMEGAALATTAKVYTYVEPAPEYVTGDIDGDGKFTDEDAAYLFANFLYGDEVAPIDYPASLDFDNDGKFTDEDAAYLFANFLYGDEVAPLYPVA